MAKILGIDLGTTNSAAAIIEAGEPTIIENSEGNRTTPSIVAISKTGERLVGQIAKRQAVTNPTNTIYGIKRFMGHTFDEEAVQKDKAMVPYEVKKGSDGGVVVKMGDKDYRPEEVSAMILSKLKADTEARLGEKITEAVITVPAYFNDSQRKATQDAGRIAGLNVRRIINEPTAAALAYGFNKKKDEKIVVYDFGGGTFDVSVLEVGDDVIEVQSSDGDAHMGGRDIDQGIFQGDVQDITLVDVIPLSLGIETMGGVNTKLIEKNTHIPTKKQQVFSTAADNQTSTEIHIVQGERPMASDNKSLGKFVLDGIPPAPRGMPQIEVTFDVDSNGVLNVTAKDKTTGKEQSIRIEANSGLSEADIERMKKEAEEHASEDERKKALIDTKNQAEQLIYTAEKSLRDHGDKIPAETKTEIEGKVSALRGAKDGSDKEAIEKMTEELSTSLQKIGEIIQKAASENTANSSADTAGDSNVRDAEVKEDKPGENK